MRTRCPLWSRSTRTSSSRPLDSHCTGALCTHMQVLHIFTTYLISTFECLINVTTYTYKEVDSLATCDRPISKIVRHAIRIALPVYDYRHEPIYSPRRTSSQHAQNTNAFRT